METIKNDFSEQIANEICVYVVLLSISELLMCSILLLFIMNVRVSQKK